MLKTFLDLFIPSLCLLWFLFVTVLGNFQIARAICQHPHRAADIINHLRYWTFVVDVAVTCYLIAWVLHHYSK